MTEEIKNNDELNEGMHEVQDSPESGAEFAPMKTNPLIEKFDSVYMECGKVLIGQEDLIKLMLTCILCEGHILLEGVPGIAKTLSAKVLSKTLDADFSRIQFTPDLLPSDIIGTSIFNMKESNFEFKKGPIFSNIVLIDEINRAPAKTQSALFEVMEERQISYDGEEYNMNKPFLVIATQNPIEQEGTYRLPEAQLDRFLMKIQLDYPSANEEFEILNRFKAQSSKIDLTPINAILKTKDIDSIQAHLDEIHIEEQMLRYITNLVQETRMHAKLYLGGSPRASLGLLHAAKVIAYLEGRSFLIPDDIQFVVPHILNHRLILSSEAEMEGMTTKDVIEEIIQLVEVPR